MKTTAGIIITDGVQIVMGHSTNNKHWDIPKGQLDEGETEIEAAIRELGEETGLVIAPAALISLGKQPYSKNKELFLFLCVTDSLPDPKTLFCSSMVVRPNEEPFPELDKFKLVRWDKIEEYAIPKLAARLLQEYPRVLGFLKA